MKDWLLAIKGWIEAEPDKSRFPLGHIMLSLILVMILTIGLVTGVLVAAEAGNGILARIVAIFGVMLQIIFLVAIVAYVMDNTKKNKKGE